MSVEFQYDSGFYPELIETERLRLERVNPNDYSDEEVFDFMSSEGVEEAFETYPYDTPDSIEEAREYLKERNYDNTEDENSMYLIKLEDSDYPFIGLEAIKKKEGKVAEIGFWITSDYWGNGYCPEASEAILELLLEEKDFEKVEVKTRDSNDKAQRAIEKFLFTLGGEKVGEEEMTLAEATEFSESDKKITEVKYEIIRENYSPNL